MPEKTKYTFLKGYTWSRKEIIAETWCSMFTENNFTTKFDYESKKPHATNEPHQYIVTDYKGQIETDIIHFFEIAQFFTPKQPNTWKPKSYKQIRKQELETKIKNTKESLNQEQEHLISLKLQLKELDQKQEEINKKILTEENESFKFQRKYGKVSKEADNSG